MKFVEKMNKHGSGGRKEEIAIDFVARIHFISNKVFCIYGREKQQKKNKEKEKKRALHHT